jgi:transposase
MDQQRLLLTNEMWAECEAALRVVRDRRGAKPELSERDFLEAVLYLARTGSPWRDLPKEFGEWIAVYMRFRRWEKAGVWRGLWEQLEQGACPAALLLFIDSTSIPVHPHAAGAPKKTAAERLWAARAEA